MKRYLLILFLLLLQSPIQAQSSLPATISTSTIPPSVQLSYTFQLKQGLVSASGNSMITWFTDHHDYKITTQSHVAVIGKVLDVTSEGTINNSRLQTRYFYEKSFLKKAQTLYIDNSQHRYHYQEGNQDYELPAVSYDRANIIWQISLWLNTNTNWIQTPSVFTSPVAERSGISSWTFSVIGREQLDTPLGILDTYHIKRLANKRQQTIDIWFAKDHHWYPVQIFFNEADGSYFRQTLTKITQQ